MKKGEETKNRDQEKNANVDKKMKEETGKQQKRIK